MKLKLLFIFLAFLANNFAVAQLNEDFDGGTFPPTDWTMEYSDTPWVQSNVVADHTTGTSYFAGYDVFFAFPGSTVGLITPLLNVTSGDQTFEFWANYYFGLVSFRSNAELYVDVSDDNGIYWTLGTTNYVSGQEDLGWFQVTIDLGDYEGQNFIGSGVKVRFRAISDGDIYNIGVDDVSGPGLYEPDCPSPSAQEVTNITNSGADLGWTDSGSYWDIYIVPSGDPAPTTGATPTVDDYTGNPYTWTGGSPNTDYDWYVRSDCGQDNTDVSFWTGPNTFTTECDVNTTFPWTEDFEGDFLPDCWFKIIESSLYNITQSNIENHTSGGSYSAGFNSPTASYDQYLFTQKQTISTDNTTLSFWHRKANATNVFFEWGIASTIDPNDFTWTAVSLSHTEWQETSVDLSSFVGQDVYIAWRSYRTNNYTNSVYLDDISINSSCAVPSDLSSGNYTTTGADLSWTDNIGSNWDIYIVPKGDPAPEAGTTPTEDDFASTFYTWTDGSIGTSYDWYVRSDCGQDNTDVSSWKGPATFNTVCEVAYPPYYENFDSETAPTFPLCMTVENTNEDAMSWVTELHIYGHSLPNSASLKFNNLEMDDWFFTQGLQLTAGVTYEVSFAYFGAYYENLEVDWGTAATSTSMSGTPIFQALNINNLFKLGYGSVTPSTSGTYYIGFHGYKQTSGNKWLSIDDVQVIEVVESTVWSGGVDTDWRKDGNWTNGLPSSTTNVIIPAGLTNYPTLTYQIAIGSMTIESDAGGDASILNDNFLIVNGDVTVQRYISGGKWHNVSAPVQNQTVNSLYQGGNPEVWLRNYNEPTNTSTYITDLTTPMPSGLGYEVWVEAGSRYDVTAEFTGDLRTTDLTLGYNQTTPLSYSGPEPLGYNLVGNPFASPLDWDIGSWIRNNIGGACWIWDPVAGNYLTRVGGAGSLPDGIIPMGQGFFIQALSSFATLRIPKNARVHSSQPFLKSSNDEELEVMSLQVNYGQMRDELTIVFNSDASTYYDDGRDARKMYSIVNNAPSLYAFEENEELSVNALPLLNGSERTVKVRFIAGEDGEYVMNANLGQLTGTKVILEDIQDSKVQNLNDNPVYQFAGTMGDQPERFLLHFIQNFTDIKPDGKETLVRIYTYDGNIYIRSDGTAANEQKEVWVYDMLGRNILQTNLSPSSLSSIPAHFTKGYLVVKVICESGTEVTKVFNY